MFTRRFHVGVGSEIPCDCNARLWIRIRQPTVFSTIGVDPAAAFNRDWQREGILNARFEKLFEFSTTALILKSLGKGNGTGADMRSVFSLATFAIGVLCFVAFVTKVRPVPIMAAPSPSEQVQVQ
jgi:hypothetical protein